MPLVWSGPSGPLQHPQDGIPDTPSGPRIGGIGSTIAGPLAYEDGPRGYPPVHSILDIGVTMREKKTMQQITIRVPQGIDAKEMLTICNHNLRLAYPTHDILTAITEKDEEQPISAHYPRSWPYVADYPDEEDA